MNQQTVVRSTSKPRQIISVSPLRSVIEINNCKLIEERRDGVWVCIKVL